MTLNSVELSRIDIPADGQIRLDLPGSAIQKLDNGRAVLRVTLGKCATEVGCGPRGCCISHVRIEDV